MDSNNYTYNELLYALAKTGQPCFGFLSDLEKSVAASPECEKYLLEKKICVGSKVKLLRTLTKNKVYTTGSMGEVTDWWKCSEQSIMCGVVMSDGKREYININDIERADDEYDGYDGM